MVAIGMYSFATLALAVGLYSGWTPFSFAVFYFFGGITNVPAFGLGSAYLAFNKDRVHIASGIYILFVLSALYSMIVAPEINLGNIEGIPEGSLALVGIAIASIVKYRKVNQDLATTNVLIATGAFAPAFSGVLLALGDGTSKALSLLVGILLIYLGYKISQRIDYKE